VSKSVRRLCADVVGCKLGRDCSHCRSVSYFSALYYHCHCCRLSQLFISAVIKGQRSWWVDWLSRRLPAFYLRYDQRSEELMGWLAEPSSPNFLSPLWSKVRGADGLTGWAVVSQLFISAMTKGQRSWWVYWLSRRLLKLLVVCQLKFDRNETWYEWCEDKELESDWADI